MMRMASAIWKAGLKEGTGLISTESGVLKEAPYSVNLGVNGQPATNPEELLAAAVASSFSIALTAELEKAFLIPERIRLAAGLMMDEACTSTSKTSSAKVSGGAVSLQILRSKRRMEGDSR